MSATVSWSSFRDQLFFDPELDLWVDLSRIGLPPSWREDFSELFANAHAEMEALEAGAIANADEKRMVGHYWLRNPERAPDPTLTAAIRSTQDQIRDFAARVHAGIVRPETHNRFTSVLSIGIGGSSLGPMFVAEALADPAAPLSMRFLDNTDPDGIEHVLKELGTELRKTLVLVISKSGSTPEPRNGAREVAHAFQEIGLNFAAHAVAITGVDSELDREAKAQGWLARFPMWDWVGGRTSVMSAVGLVPASLQGIATDELLLGAAAMDALTRRSALDQNPAALLAVAWHHATNGRGEKDMVVLPYKDRLELLSRYLQQLVMESLGKEHDRSGHTVHQGIAVYGNKGSTDQHAYVQQLRDGVPNFFATFIEILKDRNGPGFEVEPGISSGDYLSGFYQGTRRALFEKGRGSITVTMPEVSARTVGALIALFERAVGFYASFVNINAYHQPGVEAGKKAAAEVLKVQAQVLSVILAAKTPMDAEAVAAKLGTADVETVFLILRHLAANRKDVRRHPGPTGSTTRFGP